jgi:hypothetical protein
VSGDALIPTYTACPRSSRMRHYSFRELLLGLRWHRNPIPYLSNRPRPKFSSGTTAASPPSASPGQRRLSGQAPCRSPTGIQKGVGCARSLPRQLAGAFCLHGLLSAIMIAVRPRFLSPQSAIVNRPMGWSGHNSQDPSVTDRNGMMYVRTYVAFYAFAGMMMCVYDRERDLLCCFAVLRLVCVRACCVVCRRPVK